MSAHKVGDTFTRVLTIPTEFGDGYFVGWVPRSQFRDGEGTLASEVNCEWLDPLTTRTLKLRVADTTGWVPGTLLIDVQFTRTADGEVMSTTTAKLSVIQDITAP
jgi:hypothetical protein